MTSGLKQLETPMFRVIKRFGGYPCCHRQWKANSHCRFLHGYDRIIEIEWEGPRDEIGWVLDFGGLKGLRDVFEKQFDHTTLISSDDPYLPEMRKLHNDSVIDLRVMDPTMEGMAIWVAEMATTFTKVVAREAKVVRVECWENEKNAAIWVPEL